MKRIGRTIRVGLTVGIIFFVWYMRAFYDQNWAFKLFSAKHWAYVWNEFKSGWVIKATSDWVFVLTAILMIPVFIVLWWVSVKISWRKSFMLVFRKIKSIFIKPDPKKIIRKKIKIKSKASHKKVRPQPINAVGRPSAKRTGRTMDADKISESPTPTFLQTTPSSETVAEQEEQKPIFLDEATSNMSLDEIKLPERIRLEEDLVAILSGANYQVILDAVIGKLPIQYVGISSEKIVLCMTDNEKGDWLADEEFFNEEEPLWFSETSHRISPVYQLLTEAKTFAKKMADKGLKQEVVPILVEKEGTIINASDMMETWKRMSVLVCRTDLGGPDELPSFATALPTVTDKGTEADLNQVRDLF